MSWQLSRLIHESISTRNCEILCRLTHLLHFNPEPHVPSGSFWSALESILQFWLHVPNLRGIEFCGSQNFQKCLISFWGRENFVNSTTQRSQQMRQQQSSNQTINLQVKKRSHGWNVILVFWFCWMWVRWKEIMAESTPRRTRPETTSSHLSLSGRPFS